MSLKINKSLSKSEKKSDRFKRYTTAKDSKVRNAKDLNYKLLNRINLLKDSQADKDAGPSPNKHMELETIINYKEYNSKRLNNIIMEMVIRAHIQILTVQQVSNNK